ncbi:MAG: hypothetical protein L6416_07870 [Candidatus Omnitrophica bacterium]|nr:hypothetical protein [Candidatus Omnitrophota bacterium]
MKKLLKITIVILIQAFLVMDFALAGAGSAFVSVDMGETSTLAPSLNLNIETLKNMFSRSVQQAAQQNELGIKAPRLRSYEIEPQRILILNEATGKAVLGVIQREKVEWQKEQVSLYGSLRVKELSGCALITISAGSLVCVANVFPDNDARKNSKAIQNIVRQLRKTAGKLDNVQVNVIFSDLTFEKLNLGKTKNYHLFAKIIRDNLENEFGQKRVSVDVQKGKLREMIFDAKGKKWSFVNLNFKLFSRNISGGSKIFKTWIEDVLYENNNILSADTIAKLGKQLGIRQNDVLAAKAQERAKACIRFIGELPRDEKHNVYIFRDAAGLYAAHKILRADSPSAVYLSKKSFRTMTGLGIKADLLMLKIIEKALSRIGKKLSQQVDHDEYDEFKNEFFKAFEEELRQNENLRKAVRETLIYFNKEGILGHAANGLRFIDTTRKGTFPLFLEGVFSSPLTELELWDEDLRGVSTESLMFYSNLSPAISFAANEQSARRAESLFYPVEFNGEFDAGFTPIFKETSEKDKNLFYFETVILRNEALKELQGEVNPEYLARKDFRNGRLDSIIFIDVDLMRITNGYISKSNVNVLLESLGKELEAARKDLGSDNAVWFRRGGDEFVLAMNSKLGKTASDMAKQIKEKIENTVFAVGSLGAEPIDPNEINSIERNGGKVSYVGRQAILIVQKNKEKTARQSLTDFINMTNAPTGGKKLLLHGSWLDRKAINNQVSFTLSVGVAGVSDVTEVNYDAVHDLAAFRKDKSKDGFKISGNGPINNIAALEKIHEEGESIIPKNASDLQLEVEMFKEMEQAAIKQEEEGIDSGIQPIWDMSVRYFSRQSIAWKAVQRMRYNNPELFSKAIAFSMQMFGYADEAGKIKGYEEDYYRFPSAIKDNRIDTRDFKVVNEALGYRAGDEVIARSRIAAIKLAGLLEYYDVIFVRGPPAGVIGFLMPKSEEPVSLTTVQIKEMFKKYMAAVEAEFNRDNKVKAERLRIIWDMFGAAERDIGEIMNDIYKTRVVNEHTLGSEAGMPEVIQYDTASIESQVLELEEILANEAVESLEALQQLWRRGNDAVRDRFEKEQIINDLLLPSPSVLDEMPLWEIVNQSV